MNELKGINAGEQKIIEWFESYGEHSLFEAFGIEDTSNQQETEQ